MVSDIAEKSEVGGKEKSGVCHWAITPLSPTVALDDPLDGLL